ncbi:hypothetical protein [Campylobacter concisus]|jgi:hypothetical protein|uniref:hypothetical protein n=1 Tax=Campylobacter concisus TaxID=199 RepID=UPI000CD88503|nr:hypothetical protein [Campylobacter concisus]
MNSYIPDNVFFMSAVNTIIIFLLVCLCFYYIAILPKEHKEIINFLKERKHLSDAEAEFLESFSRFNSIWDNFNRPFRGVRLKDDAFIEDLMALAKEVRDRYASIKAKKEAIDNFKMGENNAR